MTALISPVRGSSATGATCACGIASLPPFLAWSRFHLSYFFARSRSTFFIVDVLVVEHLRQNAIAGLDSALRVTIGGRIVVRSANDSREVRAFRQRQLPQILPEIGDAGLRKSTNPKAPAVAQINFVGIQLEYLLLVEALLELDGNHGFGHLPPPIAFGREEERARYLHGNGASSLVVLAGVPQVGPRRSRDADEVKA